MRYVIDTLFQLTYHVVIQDRLLVKFCVVKSVKTGVEKISDFGFKKRLSSYTIGHQYF